jgi:glucuronate isomerase
VTVPLAADPDRLLPADPGTRQVARNLLGLVEKLPIVSVHGHIDIDILADDRPFTDAAALLVTPDHYVTRLLHASGVPMARLRPGDGVSSRDVWRAFCAGWPLFAGTASGYWLAGELYHVLGIAEEPSADTADELYDRIGETLATPEFRPLALLERFGVEVLATTDDPLDGLDAHRAVRARARVLPTFRPDRYLNAHDPDWPDHVERLIAAASGSQSGYAGFIAALADRRAHFIASGAVSADHGVRRPVSARLDRNDAVAVFDRLRSGTRQPGDADLFEAHMLYEMARMSVEDGLVMTVHPGIYRSHHGPTLAGFGPDTGHDIPVPTTFTAGLQPLLNDFGTAPGFHLVLFTTDETVFSRELAPLAGFYPSVYLGAPWWFLDAPYAIRRFREAVTETTGFSRSSGFIDDTRGFCSIPARHDAARRVEAGVLGRLVVERRVTEEQAADIIVDLIDAAPRRVFKLDAASTLPTHPSAALRNRRS